MHEEWSAINLKQTTHMVCYNSKIDHLYMVCNMVCYNCKTENRHVVYYNCKTDH